MELRTDTLEVSESDLFHGMDTRNNNYSFLIILESLGDLFSPVVSAIAPMCMRQRLLAITKAKGQLFKAVSLREITSSVTSCS